MIDEAHTVSVRVNMLVGYLFKSMAADYQTFPIMYASATPGDSFRQINKNFLHLPKQDENYVIKSKLRRPRPGDLMAERPVCIGSLREFIFNTIVSKLQYLSNEDIHSAFTPYTYQPRFPEDLCYLNFLSTTFFAKEGLVSLALSHVNNMSPQYFNRERWHVAKKISELLNKYGYRKYDKERLDKNVNSTLEYLFFSNYDNSVADARRDLQLALNNKEQGIVSLKDAIIKMLYEIPYQNRAVYMRSVDKLSIAKMALEALHFRFRFNKKFGFFSTKKLFSILEEKIHDDIDSFIKNVLSNSILNHPGTPGSSASKSSASSSSASSSSRLKAEFDYSSEKSIKATFKKYTINQRRIADVFSSCYKRCAQNIQSDHQHDFLQYLATHVDYVDGEFMMALELFIVNLIQFVEQLKRLFIGHTKANDDRLTLEFEKGIKQVFVSHCTSETLTPTALLEKIEGYVEVLISNNHLSIDSKKWLGLSYIHSYLQQIQNSDASSVQFDIQAIFNALRDLARSIRENVNFFINVNSFHDHFKQPAFDESDICLNNLESNRCFPVKFQYLRDVIDHLRDKGVTLIYTSMIGSEIDFMMDFLTNGHLYGKQRSIIGRFLFEYFEGKIDQQLPREICRLILSFVDNAKFTDPRLRKKCKNLTNSSPEILEKLVRKSEKGDILVINGGRLVHGTNALGDVNIVTFDFTGNFTQLLGRLARNTRSHNVNGKVVTSSGVFIDIRKPVSYSVVNRLYLDGAFDSNVTVSPLPITSSSSQAQLWNSLSKGEQLTLASRVYGYSERRDLMTPVAKLSLSELPTSDSRIISFLSTDDDTFSLKYIKKVVGLMLITQARFQKHPDVIDFKKNRILCSNVIISSKKSISALVKNRLFRRNLRSSVLFFSEKLCVDANRRSGVKKDHQRLMQTYLKLGIKVLTLYGLGSITHKELTAPNLAPFYLIYARDLKTGEMTPLDGDKIPFVNPLRAASRQFQNLA